MGLGGNMEDIEKCPKCNSIFIQAERITKECYCLEKACSYRWTIKLPKDTSEIINPYLRASIS